MEFGQVIEEMVHKLDEAGIRYAVIGGFAMTLHGIQRATIDLDFILMLEDLERTDGILRKAGYRRAFRSENVSHYLGESAALGRIDILHAFRGPSLSMLARAKRIPVTPQASLPVVAVEDLIGLKVQAARNDALRRASDWTDIRLLVESKANYGGELDWDLLTDYLTIFDQKEKLALLEEWYGAVNPDG